MNPQNEKCVMVIDRALPMGVIANTAAILGITLGKHRPETVGGPKKKVNKLTGSMPLLR